jgi:hypothetical protein
MNKCSVIDFILGYAELDSTEMSEIYQSSNRINRKGDQLEFFVKDLFCDSVSVNNKDEKEEIHSKYLSWLGRKNHPPDFMVRDGEAVEVKKVSSKAGSIQLNSSHPHQTLSSDYSRLTNACVECEEELGGWSEKDLIYTLGRVESGSREIDFMWVIYGDCWAAPDTTYSKLESQISNKINEGISELEYGELNENTNELGRVNNADACGRTKLRIRPMWAMSHPANYFAQFIDDYDSKIENSNPLFTVIRKDKFESLPEKDQKRVKNNSKVNIKEISIPDPNGSDARPNALVLYVEI